MKKKKNMKQKKKNSLPVIVLGMLASILLLSNLQTVAGLTAPISMTDGINDVFRIDLSSNNIQQGFTMDDIDITELNATGQNVTLTIRGDLANWNASYSATIYFSDKTVDLDGPEYPYYSLLCVNETSGIRVFLVYTINASTKYYFSSRGPSWEEYKSDNFGSTIGSNTIHIEVPTGAGYSAGEGYTIPDGVSLTAVTNYTGEVSPVAPGIGYIYGDILSEIEIPDCFEIPGYDLILFSGVIIGMTTLLILKKRHYKR